MRYATVEGCGCLGRIFGFFNLDRRMLLKNKISWHVRIVILLVLITVLASVSSVYAKRGGRLELEIVDDQTGQPVACRVHISRVMPGPKARAKSIPQKVKGLPFLGDHFVCPGHVVLDLAEGNYEFEIERGPEYPITSGHFRIETFADDKKTVRLRRFVDMAAEGWWSGDLGVMRPVDQIELLMLAEDLHLATVLTWTNETGWVQKTAMEKERNQISPIGAFDSKVVRFNNDYYYSLGAGRVVWSEGQLGCYLSAKPLDFSDGVFAALQKGKDPGSWTEAMAGSILDLPVLVALGQVDSVRIAGELDGTRKNRQAYRRNPESATQTFSAASGKFALGPGDLFPSAKLWFADTTFSRKRFGDRGKPPWVQPKLCIR